MMPDRVAASIASFDFLYLSALGERRVVAPSVRSSDARVSSVTQSGGHVLEPVTGRHRNVWIFDFKSLYPSIIRTLNIDPLGYREDNPEGTDLIETVSGAGFAREAAILPGMLDALFPRREAARQAGDEVASQAIKILMNSFYGVLGTPACRFYNPALANAITHQGKHFLLWAKNWFEHKGYRVLYGDTDSLFIASGGAEAEVEYLQTLGSELAAQLSSAMDAYVSSRWRVTCHLELEFEKLYTQLFLPSVRGGAGGARKRYAGRLSEGKVEFVGMEVVRRDWTNLAKTVQRELYARLFSDEPVVEYLADIVARVRGGEMDGELIYRKGLRKSLDTYTASTPPHVVAARKSSTPPGRVITYVITVAGPEPVDHVEHDLDREHYVNKQIRPVAEPVLGALGLEFDQVIGDDRQIRLF
jgi:DNA polymerase-2